MQDAPLLDIGNGIVFRNLHIKIKFFKIFLWCRKSGTCREEILSEETGLISFAGLVYGNEVPSSDIFAPLKKTETPPSYPGGAQRLYAIPLLPTANFS